MSHEFYLKLKSRTGTTKRAVIGNYLSLIYENGVNRAGALDFSVPVDSGIPDIVEALDQVEVWRRDKGVGMPWHLDWSGLFMDSDEETDDDGLELFRAYCIGDNGILSFRHVSWPAGVDNRSTFAGVVAETALKTLVQYNCTASASVANGRLREGDLAAGMGLTITIEADSGGGDPISKSFSNGNLLTILSETIAPLAGGDFSLEKVGDATWEFRWHPGQLGEDKSSGANQIEFSPERNNMIRPRKRTRRTDARSVAIVGGQGEGTQRAYSIVLGHDYAATYDREMFVDARNEVTAEGRVFSGQTALEARETVEELEFEIVQTESIFYCRVPVPRRKTYREGDLVLAKYKGVSQVRKVTSVTVEVKKGGGGLPFQVYTETEIVL